MVWMLAVSIEFIVAISSGVSVRVSIGRGVKVDVLKAVGVINFVADAVDGGTVGALPTQPEPMKMMTHKMAHDLFSRLFEISMDLLFHQLDNSSCTRTIKLNELVCNS